MVIDPAVLFLAGMQLGQWITIAFMWRMIKQGKRDFADLDQITLDAIRKLYKPPPKRKKPTKKNSGPSV